MIDSSAGLLIPERSNIPLLSDKTRVSVRPKVGGYPNRKCRHEYVAIIVGKDHCILGCLAENADELASAARTIASRVVILSVTVAGHTPLLDPAVMPFRQALLGRNCQAFNIPVLAGVNAYKVLSKEQMGQWLPEAIHRTVRWDLVLSRLTESHCSVFLELGAGRQLAQMASVEKPDGEARSISEFRSIDGIVAWVEKAVERMGSC